MTDSENDLTAAVERAVPADLPPYSAVLARRDRRRNRRRAVAGSVGAAVLVAGVLGGTALLGGDEPASLPPADRSSTPPVTPSDAAETLPDVAPEWDGQGAPPVVLQLDGRELRLRPWSSCYSSPPDDSGVSAGQCVDGFAQPPYEDAGARASVPFSFPLAGWRFQATFTSPGGGDCARRTTLPVRRTGDFTFLVPPAGPAGTYDVELFGRGPGGDVVTTFTWTTTESGDVPEPSGYVGLVSDDGKKYVAYPLELGLQDLATTPRRASVTLTVTAADGESTTVGPVRAEREPCSGAGRVFFRGPGSGAARPFDLGPAPFTYRAEITLDGTTYVGSAVWPRDENDEPPYTDLTFEPPLPSYGG